MAKASSWKATDAEARKLGERSRLETCVVLAVNACLLAAFVPTLRQDGCGEGNPLSKLPGDYGRKAKTQRNWRGGTQPVEHVVQFETNRRTSPGLDISAFSPEEIRDVRKEAGTGAAWLSSARSVRSALKWDNERNPYPVLNLSQETVPTIVGKEGGADVKSAWPLCPGLHTCYNGKDNGLCHTARWSESLKPSLSWD